MRGLGIAIGLIACAGFLTLFCLVEAMYKTFGSVISSPSIGSDGTVYVESDIYVYALAESSNEAK